MPGSGADPLANKISQIVKEISKYTMSQKLKKEVFSPRPRQFDQEDQGGKEEAPHDSLVTCERHVPCLLQSTFSSESNILSCLCWSHVLSNDDGGTKFFNSTGRHLFVPLQHSLTIYVTKNLGTANRSGAGCFKRKATGCKIQK